VKFYVENLENKNKHLWTIF